MYVAGFGYHMGSEGEGEKGKGLTRKDHRVPSVSLLF